MSKKTFAKVTAHNRVQAVFARFKRDKQGNITNVPLYDIYGPEYLRRWKQPHSLSNNLFCESGCDCCRSCTHNFLNTNYH